MVMRHSSRLRFLGFPVSHGGRFFWKHKTQLALSLPDEIGRNWQFAIWNDLEPTLTNSPVYFHPIHTWSQLFP